MRAARSALAALAFASPALAIDDALVAAAKKEGRVVWYTTQIIDQLARPAALAFEKKYGVRVDYVRADSSDISLRIANEAKAGRVEADLFDGSAAVAALRKQGLVLRFAHAGAERLPERYRDRNNFWTAHNEFIFAPAYNTDLVRKEYAPKSFDDLLDPKWKGRMVWSAQPISSGAPGFVGLILTARGEAAGMEFLRKLAKQEIASPKVSARQVLDQVVAGEYALSPHTFNHQSVISAARGAPVAWIPVSPAMSVLSVGAITRDAPHPAAAKLLADFLISSEGQTLFRDSDYLPVDPNVPPREKSLRPDGERFTAITMTPEDIEERMPAWVRVYNEIFR